MTTRVRKFPRTSAINARLLGKAVAAVEGAARVSRSKYRNRPLVYEGQFFASQAECRRYKELMFFHPVALRCQPRFPLIVNGKTICTYVPDFYYREGDREICEDVKGYETAVFKLKRKLFEALHPTIELRVISAKGSRRNSGAAALPATASAAKPSDGCSGSSRKR